jgi:hypothetical protein
MVRPLPPQPQLTAQVAGRVAGWSKMRVRDELGLDKMLAEDAKVGAVMKVLSWDTVEYQVSASMLWAKECLSAGARYACAMSWGWVRCWLRTQRLVLTKALLLIVL